MNQYPMNNQKVKKLKSNNNLGQTFQGPRKSNSNTTKMNQTHYKYNNKKVNYQEEVDYEDNDEEASDTRDDINDTQKDDKGMIKSLKKRIQKDYSIIKVIGRGSYGMVSKAICK